MPYRTLDPSLEPKEQLTLSQAFLWIFLSTLLVTGTCTMGWLYYEGLVQRRCMSSHYTVRALMQRGPSAGVLESHYLAEWLGLSEDAPENLYKISKSSLSQRLLDCPLIQSGAVSKRSPDILVLEYTVRKPQFISGDFTRTLVDAEGVLMPSDPPVCHGHLPRLRLAQDAYSQGKWGGQVANAPWKLAQDLLAELGVEGFIEMDLSRMDHPSAGRRELLFAIQGEAAVCWLRLCPETWRQGVEAYRRLRTEGLLGNYVELDLRLPGMAFGRKKTDSPA